MNGFKTIQGDSLIKLEEMIEHGIMVDCVITDPPYNIARDNNFHTMGRAGIDFGEWDRGFDQFGWLGKLNKILNKNGSVIIFNDWKNIGEIARCCEKVGFEIKDMLRWEKTNPMPRNRDRRYITDYECAVWLVKKGAKWTFNRLLDTYQRPKFVYGVVSGKEKVHPTQKPVKLMEEIIKIHTNENDLVLDCFMGSGSTGVACANLNRRFIGIELDNTYYEIANKRISDAYQQHPCGDCAEYEGCKKDNLFCEFAI